jgi:hypothetical protein
MRSSVHSFYRLLVLFFLVSFLSPQFSFAQTSFTDADFRDKRLSDSTSTQFVNTTGGEVILQTGENENLALRRSAFIAYTNVPPTDTNRTNPNKLLDNDPFTFLEILPPGGDFTTIRIDLQATRRINKVRLWAFGFNQRLRPRAYSIYVGLDSITNTKVAQRLSNTDTVTTDVFEPIVGRFVWISIDVVDRQFSTVLSEIQVFGVGYLSNGVYTSSIRDVKRNVNWGKLNYTAVIPEGTEMTFQFRTGANAKNDTTWSEWSPSVKLNNALYDVFEPRRFIQYRVNFGTSSLETPRLQSLTLNYDTLLVARTAVAKIQPSQFPILRPIDAEYQIRATMDANSVGIDTIVINTPSPSVVTGVTANNVAVNYTYRPEPDRILVALSSRVTASSDIAVKFKVTPYLDRNPFSSRIIGGRTGGNPQRVDTETNNGVEGWTLVATDVADRLLVDVKASPNPFTPNGDGKNDKTRFSFFLANLNIPRPLTIRIFDMTGRVVRTVLETKSVANAYVEGNAIEWDGRDDSGKLVRPGIYIYQVNIEADKQVETVSKTVVVAY